MRRFKLILSFLKAGFTAWIEDRAFRLGAALAYYTVFSLAPLLVIAVAIAGAVFGEQAARGEIVEQIESTIGRPGAEVVEQMLQRAQPGCESAVAGILGLAMLMFGATGVFIQLQDSLNTVWKVAPKPGRGILGVIRDRLISFTIVVSTGFLLLVSLVVSAGLAALNRWITPAEIPGGTWVWEMTNIAISFGLITLLFALIFKVLPDAVVAWRDVWVGAAITAILFTVGKYLIGLYLARGTTTSVFGAAGSFVIVLLWVYYSSLILLLGAELTRVFANRYGERVRPAENAVAVIPARLALDRIPMPDRDGSAPAGKPEPAQIGSRP